MGGAVTASGLLPTGADAEVQLSEPHTKQHSQQIGLHRPMRICYVSSVLNIHDYRFLSALVAGKYDVHLISYAAAKRYQAVPKLIRDIGGLNILHRPFEFTSGYGLLAPLVVLDFCNILRKLRPHVLHTGWLIREGLLGALSGFHPVLLMPHGSDILIEPEKSIVTAK